MARRSNTESLDARLAEIVDEHVRSLADALTDVVRRSVSDDLEILLGTGTLPERGRRGAARSGRPRKKNIRPCIAAGCKNPSKGPRFKYLCDEHRGASQKQIEEWRQASKNGGGKDAKSAKRGRKGGRKQKAEASAQT